MTVNMGCYRSVVNGHGQITVMVITHNSLYRQAERQADKQADRLTGRETDRQADRQGDKRADREEQQVVHSQWLHQVIPSR